MKLPIGAPICLLIISVIVYFVAPVFSMPAAPSAWSAPTWQMLAFVLGIISVIWIIANVLFAHKTSINPDSSTVHREEREIRR